MTNTKASVYDRDGVFLRFAADGEFLADGESIRVSLSMMDALDPLQRRIMQDSATQVMHQPGQVQIADSDRQRREETLMDQKQRLSDAWKNPTPDTSREQAVGDTAQPGTRDAVDAAYESRNAELEGAWR